MEAGALKTKAAKYNTKVQQKEQKRKAPKPTLRNEGQGDASTEQKQKAQKAETTSFGKPNIREPDYLYHWTVPEVILVPWCWLPLERKEAKAEVV